MDADIAKLLKDSKTIAVIGASSNPARSSNGIMAYLQRAGYRVIPVNPNETEVLGEKAYPTLAAVPADIKIDIVDVFRRPAHTPEFAKAAVQRKQTNGDVKAFWMQTGITNDEAMQTAKDGGLIAIQDECIAVRHRLLV